MKTTIIVTLLATATVTVLSGCSATPVRTQSAAQPGTVFAQPAEKTQKAAVDALVVLGFEIKKTEALYVEGFRPRKIGLFVGSGGETAGVWLEAVGADRTRVVVDTAKSIAGIVGQKNWDSEILAEMSKALSK